MKKLLLTGSTGFVGRNIAPLLREKFDVSAPGRAELNLLDGDAVRDYLRTGQFDAVVHLANPTGNNPVDKENEIFERSLRVFMSLERCADLYGRMIYLGSGAEYGKHRDISSISEDEFGKELPRDPYGLSRYIMNKLAAGHDNIVNLRLFGCYGAGDPPFKLMPGILACIREGSEVRLNQDVWFDFLYVEDIFPVIVHFVESARSSGAFNLCEGRRIRISSIAGEIMSQTGASLPVVFRKEGLNLEYTGDNSRLRAEIPSWEPLPIREGIRRMLEHENW